MFLDVIKDYSNYAGDYNGGLSNHLFMVLYALHSLGASEANLHSFAKNMIAEKQLPLEDYTVAFNITNENFSNYLGNSNSYGSYYLFFKNQINTYGINATLTTYLDQLMEGVAARAFHALIRIAYALESENKQEIISSLSYFAYGYLRHQVPSSVKPSENLVQELVSLRQVIDYKSLEKNFIFNRIQNAFYHPEFNKTIVSLEHLSPSEILDKLDMIINKLFIDTNDFTLLHAVTSKEAIRTVLPYFTNASRALNHYWYAIAAAFLTVNASVSESFECDVNIDGIDQGEIVSKALNSTDIHAIKLVYSTLKEYNRSHNDVYLYMAHRAISN